MFFSDHWKFHLDTKSAKKISQKCYGFFVNLIWIGNGKFSLLLREHSQFPINLSSSSPKISDLIENNFFELNLVQNEEKVGQKYFSADFTSFWD